MPDRHTPAALPCLVWLASLVVLLCAVPSAAAADIASLQARVDAAKGEARNLASAVQMRTAELEAARGKVAAAAQRQAVLEA